jgi:hypothetical protein
VLALTAVVRPILRGVLFAIKRDIAEELGGHQQLKLKMLPRAYRPGDGDCGICFEYAVHEALKAGDPRVVERIADAAKLCRLEAQTAPQSILFGLEKSGAQQLIDTAENILTNDSRLLHGTRGQPVKLRKHLTGIAGAFRKPSAALALPFSISGLWKADLFVGFSDEERWVATTVKINPQHLEGARGLRIGIVPTKQGRSDSVRRDDDKNLIICPLRHDQDFMQIFYEGWRVVQAFIRADAQIPTEVALPSPVEREVARILAERREYPVLDVIEAIEPFGQPKLLETNEKQLELQLLSGQPATDMVVAPISRSFR